MGNGAAIRLKTHGPVAVGGRIMSDRGRGRSALGRRALGKIETLIERLDRELYSQ